ncbi:MFS transporter [Cellulosimicrobium cellulans]|uniref:MFS transporter n=1 Tax=Cellulosimicrobium cellulans TaxID=1710 RepID=UPI00240683DE|nr:MFS transporter [Cellulosimicrobium cellulans]MDF9877495.1 MFS family permease [Cellulosimicrobium cellulans]
MRDHVLDVRPLRSSRAYRDLWAGSAVGGLGFQIANVAVLLQVWELTHSPLWTGTIGLATAIPLLTLGLVGGHLADVHDRRTIMRLAAAGQVLAAVGLAAQALAVNRSVWVLLGLVSLGAACNALGSPARRTVPPRLLPPDQVAAGLALQNLAFQVAMLVGPALAGLVLARWDLPAAYGLQAVAAVVALLGLVRLPPLPPGRPPATPPGPSDAVTPVVRVGAPGDDRAVAAEALDETPATGAPTAAPAPRRRAAAGGWWIVWRKPTLRGSFATDVAATVLAMPISLFPLVNELRFDGDPRTLGLFLSAVAVGGIGAGLFSGAVTRAPRAGALQLAAAATWGVALAGFGLAGPLWLALACLAVAGAADTVSVVTRGALVQLETPDEFRGRVSSVEHVVGVAGPEVGNFRGGVLASLTSAPVALVAGGLAASAVVGVVAWRNAPLRRYRTPAPEPVRTR